MNIFSSTQQRLFNQLLVLVCLALPSLLVAQRNTELLSRTQFGADCNDIWGWVAENGNEYALVGLRNALAIVDISDPRSPREITRIGGATSTWRDIKTWENYAFVTNETGNGLQVIDLSNIPTTGRATAFNWTPNISGLGTLSTCHNIYIDEFGIAYLAGCNLNSGGPIFVDVTRPANPRYVGRATNRYAHDVYVRDNKMYSSDIYNGQIAITDVSDKSSPRRLGAQTTPSRFTHNAWLSDDGRTVYTTDERSNAPVAAYNVSNPSNISKLYEFRSNRTVGSGVIPHNVHVLNDWLVISNYTDGVVIVDATHPDNLIEVGNYDTEPTLNSSFRGAWGAYPFLPSGNILVSDIKNGLFVVGIDYKRAAHLEGVVRDGTSGALLNGVTMTINSTEIGDQRTNFQGEFKTGVAEAGRYRLTFSKADYLSKTIDVDLVNGELIDLEVNLFQTLPANVSGRIVDSLGNPINGAKIRFSSQNNNYSATTDAFGSFFIEDIPQNEYNIYITAWGYLPFETEAFFSPGGSNFAIALEAGYYDDFNSDLGWTGFNVASSFGGDWERMSPTGIMKDGDLITPDGDLSDDMGTQCYVTGRDDTPVLQDEVNNGLSILASPILDLSTYEYPMFTISTWFFTQAAAGEAAMNITVTNGQELVTLETITASTSRWEEIEFALAEYITSTATMQISIEVFEMATGTPITEAAIDGFLVKDSNSPIEPPMEQDTIAFYLEAECALFGADWEAQSRADASNAFYTVLPWQGTTLRTPPTEEKDILQFTFDIEEAGTYHVYARVQANNEWHNSFWVRADEEAWISFEDIPENISFEWTAVQNSEADNAVVDFQLEAGTHTLDFGLQEDGTRLDKIMIVSANTIEPAGIGEEIACADLDEDNILIASAPQLTTILFPNPTAADVELRFQNDAPKTIEVRSIKGALLLQQKIQNDAYRVDLSAYATGLYIISVIDANGVWQEQVVKQ